MSHHCPECHSLCHCNGDIDDCCLELDINSCICCIERVAKRESIEDDETDAHEIEDDAQDFREEVSGRE